VNLCLVTKALSTLCVRIGLCFVCLITPTLFRTAVDAQTGGRSFGNEKNSAAVSAAAAPLSQNFTEAGIAVKFSVQPMSGSAVLEQTEATIKFEISETATNKPLINLRPSAWISRNRSDTALEAKSCREKIQSLLQANFAEKADLDLNSYFILTLNREANVSVIDPYSGFGVSRLYTLVPLKSAGEDWILSSNQKQLYISMPLVNEVAVVDTSTWKVLANIDAGPAPSRIALQHDGRYLWVTNDSRDPQSSGVTVIDTNSLTTAGRIKTGPGIHEISFTDDDRYAFVTSEVAGTLAVIDVRKLAKIKELNVGSRPRGLAYSSLSKVLYIATEGEGDVVAVDGLRHEEIGRIKLNSGLRALRFMPGGRYLFAANMNNDTVSIIDISANKVLQQVPVGGLPDQITFTRDFAYVRSTGNEFVTMINLARLGAENSEVSINRFPGGQKAPREASAASRADMLVPPPESGAMLVANPADKMIYFYTEGMAAPMGSFQNYRREPRALLVLDKSLRETAPGVYTTTVRLPFQGRYDVPFLLDSPKVVNCFDFNIHENPKIPKAKPVSVRVEPLTFSKPMKVGETYDLRFRIVDADSGRPNTRLDDWNVLVFLAPGIWQQRGAAKSLGNGVFQMSVKPPSPGVYYVFFECPSAEIHFTQLPSLNLEAVTSAERH